MLILLGFSLFFLYLIYREFNNPNDLDNFTKGYIAVLAILALLATYPIMDHWRFERLLSAKTSQLADNRHAEVTCTTVFQSVYDTFGLAGTANPTTGVVILQYPTCNELRDYIDSPETASTREIYSLSVFTHEAMHVRGELDEQKTECQSIQRFVRSAKLFGVPTHIAERQVKGYYRGPYEQHPYFSEKCAEGKAFDEGLGDPAW